MRILQPGLVMAITTAAHAIPCVKHAPALQIQTANPVLPTPIRKIQLHATYFPKAITLACTEIPTTRTRVQLPTTASTPQKSARSAQLDVPAATYT